MKQLQVRRRHHRQADQDVASAESITGDAVSRSTVVSVDAARLLLRIIALLDEERGEPLDT